MNAQVVFWGSLLVSVGQCAAPVANVVCMIAQYVGCSSVVLMANQCCSGPVAVFVVLVLIDQKSEKSVCVLYQLPTCCSRLPSFVTSELS